MYNITLIVREIYWRLKIFWKYFQSFLNFLCHLPMTQMHLQEKVLIILIYFFLLFFSSQGLKVVAQVLEEELNSSSIYIPTAVDSAHSSIAAPPTHHTLDKSFHSALLTPPTNPLMSLDTTPTASSSNNPLTTLPLDQSTPHKGGHDTQLHYFN